MSHPTVSKLVPQSLIPSKLIAAEAEVAARGAMCMYQSCKAGDDGQCWLKSCLYTHRLCEANESEWNTCCRDWCYWEAEPEHSSRAVVLACLFTVCSESVGTSCLLKRSSDWNSVCSPCHMTRYIK